MAKTKKRSKAGKENKRPAEAAKPARKLRLWTDESMVGAMKAVQEGRLEVKSCRFGVRCAKDDTQG